MCMFCRYLFVPLAIVLSVLCRFTDSDYPLVSSTSSYSYGDFDASDGNGMGQRVISSSKKFNLKQRIAFHKYNCNVTFYTGKSDTG